MSRYEARLAAQLLCLPLGCPRLECAAEGARCSRLVVPDERASSKSEGGKRAGGASARGRCVGDVAGGGGPSPRGGLISFEGLVSTDEIGRPLRHEHVTRHHRRACAMAGLPYIRPHDLRHTCATLLLSAGVNPKVVSEMLGHSSVMMTLDRYSHVLPHMQSAAVSALSRLLASDTGGSRSDERDDSFEREYAHDVS